jgi:hypothetical protein
MSAKSEPDHGTAGAEQAAAAAPDQAGAAEEEATDAGHGFAGVLAEPNDDFAGGETTIPGVAFPDDDVGDFDERGTVPEGIEAETTHDQAPDPAVFSDALDTLPPEEARAHREKLERDTQSEPAGDDSDGAPRA